MGIFTKFLKSIDVFGKDYKFFITNKKNIFKSTFGGLMTIIYFILLILAIIYSYTKYASSLPKIEIFNNLEKCIDHDFDTTSLNSTVNITNMYIRDFRGGNYHKLFVYLKYKNLSNEENFSSIEVVRPFMPNNYSIQLNLSILKEVEMKSIKIFYSPCNIIDHLKPNVTINQDLLENCNHNITEFYDFMRRNKYMEEPVVIIFNTLKLTINPFLNEKYNRYQKTHVDYIKIQDIKSKNQIDFKWYIFEESYGWNNLNTNVSYGIDLDYEVGYPVYIDSDYFLYQGYYEEFTININKKKNLVRITYMNIYELLSLLGGYMNVMTFIFRFIINLVTENNVQIYKMIKEFSSRKSKEKNGFEDSSDCIVRGQINKNLLSVNDISFTKNDNHLENTLSNFDRSLYKFSFFRLYNWCCCRRNDKRNDVIDYVKYSLSIFHLQTKLNELEIIKYLLLDQGKIQKIRDFSQLNNPKMISIRFEEFIKSDVNTISEYMKSWFNTNNWNNENENKIN